MWTKTYSKIYQNVSKDAVWKAWADVHNWPKWDKELEYCNVNPGFTFTSGNQFTLKPLGGPKVRITISEVRVNRKFTDFCQFFGAKMYDAHELEETPNGLLIKSTISVTGLLSFLWVKLVAKNVANSVPSQMDALVNYASSNNG